MPKKKKSKDRELLESLSRQRAYDRAEKFLGRVPFGEHHDVLGPRPQVGQPPMPTTSLGREPVNTATQHKPMERFAPTGPSEAFITPEQSAALERLGIRGIKPDRGPQPVPHMTMPRDVVREAPMEMPPMDVTPGPRIEFGRGSVEPLRPSLGLELGEGTIEPRQPAIGLEFGEGQITPRDTRDRFEKLDDLLRRTEKIQPRSQGKGYARMPQAMMDRRPSREESAALDDLAHRQGAYAHQLPSPSYRLGASRDGVSAFADPRTGQVFLIEDKGIR
jgi:hypothetical protein